MRSPVVDRLNRLPHPAAAVLGAAFGGALWFVGFRLVGGVIGPLLAVTGCAAVGFVAWRSPYVLSRPPRPISNLQTPPEPPDSQKRSDSHQPDKPPLDYDPRRIDIAMKFSGLLRLLPVRAGSFLMGSPREAMAFPGNRKAYGDESPQHEVTISAFDIAETVVTRALWREVRSRETASQLPEPEPWAADGDAEQTGALPANHVSWFDAVEFCNALSRLCNLRECYRRTGDHVEWIADADGLRLPTEAEFEYACRAGTTTTWFCGEDEAELQRFAWFDANSDYRLHPVKTRDPNPSGLHDMVGNVWQWCFDGRRAYDDKPQVDPVGPSEAGSDRAARGGSFRLRAWFLRSALRFVDSPENRVGNLGFRVVRGARRQHG